MNYRNPSGIYIHIPFCQRKCSYCDFYSVVKPKDLLISDYITCLINEITQTSRNYASLNNQIESVYFGGGTPSLLKPEFLEDVITTLEDSFNFSFKNLAENTIEVNPGTVNFSYLSILKELGFNRISIGVQSLNDNLLKLMGRIHSAQEGIDTVRDAYKAGFNNISVDIIFNYPTQSQEDVLDSLGTLTSLPGVKHISAYSLQVEEKTRLARQIEKGKLVLNPEDKERETYYLINEFLEENDYNHYEISNYSLPNFESRQNNLYWTLGSYYGFGPSSASFLQNFRTENRANLSEYLKNNGIGPQTSRALTEQELKEEFMFLGLRRLAGIQNKDYKKLFGSSFFDDFDNVISKLLKREMIDIINDSIRLTPLGLDFADQVALEFLL